jgi:pantetheine-phosphate adenylyltransferase
MNPRRLLFPGSFDPLHCGHLDLIVRGAALCDELLVGVAVHPDKTSFLPVAERLRLLAMCTAPLGNVRVIEFSGATVRTAQAHGASLLRGLRNPLDVDHERGMAEIHRSHGVETVLLLTSGAFAHISSSLVRSVLAAGLPIAELVPPAVAAHLTR